MEIDKVRQWMLWDLDGDQKRPKNIQGYWSGSTHSHDYVTRAEAAIASVKSQGLAFCFTPDDPYCGIDLDDCLEGDRFKAWAVEILQRFTDTYAEVSPSGCGVKIYCRAKLPDKCRHNVPVEDGAVEIYDRGRFFAFTGEHVGGFAVEVTDQQESVDWLVGRHFAIESKPTTTVRTIEVPVGSLSVRAIQYADNCDIVNENSGRNNSLYRVAAHIAGFSEQGRSIDESDVLAACRHLNATRFRPPLDDNEVERTVANALKYREARPPSESYTFTEPDVDLGKFLANQSPAMPPPTKPPPKRFSSPWPSESANAPGFIGDFVEWCLAGARYPQPQLAWGAAITLLGALTGRKIAGPNNLRTNIYVLGTSPAGSGKSHPRDCMRELLELADADEYLGNERIASQAGLIKALVMQPSLVFPLDEIGKFLTGVITSRDSHLRQVISVLLELYSSAGRTWKGDAYADINKTPVIEHPHCCVYGTTTGETLWPKMTSDSVYDGFLPRMALVEGPYVDPVEISQESPKPPVRLVEAAKSWTEFHNDMRRELPNPKVIHFDAAALSRSRAHEKAIGVRRKRDAPMAAAIWSRVAERSNKLALLFACSRGGPDVECVTVDDVDRAVAVSNWMARLLIERVTGFSLYAENQVEKDARRVLEIITKYQAETGDAITRHTLTRKTQWLKARDRNDVLQTLIESEQIGLQRVESLIGSGATRVVDSFFVRQ